MSRSFCTSFVLFTQIIVELILMAVAMQITAICGQEGLFDRIGVVSGLKMIALLYIFFSNSLGHKTRGMLIIICAIVASVYEQEEVAPVDEHCTISQTDYFKKDLAIFLFAMYGVATELRYIWYFISLFFYMTSSNSEEKQMVKGDMHYYTMMSPSTQVVSQVSSSRAPILLV